jgi:hypothetical protein
VSELARACATYVAAVVACWALAASLVTYGRAFGPCQAWPS